MGWVWHAWPDWHWRAPGRKPGTRGLWAAALKLQRRPASAPSQPTAALPPPPSLPCSPAGARDAHPRHGLHPQRKLFGVGGRRRHGKRVAVHAPALHASVLFAGGVLASRQRLEGQPGGGETSPARSPHLLSPMPPCPAITPQVRYWKTNLELVKSLPAHREAVRQLAFAPGDLKFATASDDSTVRVRACGCGGRWVGACGWQSLAGWCGGKLRTRTLPLTCTRTFHPSTQHSTPAHPPTLPPTLRSGTLRAAPPSRCWRGTAATQSAWGGTHTRRCWCLVSALL